MSCLDVVKVDRRVSELVERVYELVEKVAALERGSKDVEQTPERSEDGLKSCPFCGESESLIVKSGKESSFYVCCDTCWAKGPPRSEEEQSKRRWSRRVT